jgi:hypothetical protein
MSLCVCVLCAGSYCWVINLVTFSLIPYHRPTNRFSWERQIKTHCCMDFVLTRTYNRELSRWPAARRLAKINKLPGLPSIYSILYDSTVQSISSLYLINVKLISKAKLMKHGWRRDSQISSFFFIHGWCSTSTQCALERDREREREKAEGFKSITTLCSMVQRGVILATRHIWHDVRDCWWGSISLAVNPAYRNVKAYTI